MNYWSSQVDRLVRVQGYWIRQSGFDAIEPTALGQARIHLRGGTVLDIDPPDGALLSKWIDEIARKLFKEEA